MNEWQDWIGRSQCATDTLEPARSNALTRTLGTSSEIEPGDPLPLLHHWLYFWDVRPPVGLGPDGHPARGGFLPPVPLPRRMWAGGRLRFHKPLVCGTTVTRNSTITAITQKTGRSGTLLFVTVEHTIGDSEGIAVWERQDIVYREAAAAGSISRSPEAPDAQAEWREVVFPDPVLLFRYSALTMNGHRIHYDRTYATEQEAYPALVVHGPLQATLLIDLAARNLGKPIAAFDFRGQQPAFDGSPLLVCGEPDGENASLWTQQGAARCMVASASTVGAES